MVKLSRTLGLKQHPDVLWVNQPSRCKMVLLMPPSGIHTSQDLPSPTNTDQSTAEPWDKPLWKCWLTMTKDGHRRRPDCPWLFVSILKQLCAGSKGRSHHQRLRQPLSPCCKQIPGQSNLTWEPCFSLWVERRQLDSIWGIRSLWQNSLHMYLGSRKQACITMPSHLVFPR